MRLPSLTFRIALAFLAVAALPLRSAAQQLAFSRQTPIGGAKMSIANPGGSDEHEVPLFYPAAGLGLPIWSPDGNQLLVSRVLRRDTAGNLLSSRPATVDADGASFNLWDSPNLPFDRNCAASFPDGTRLLCAFAGEQPGVFSVRASDGSDAVRLTTNPYFTAGIDLPGDLSPDGRQFVFLRIRSGSPLTPRAPIQEQTALFVANIDGTGFQQLTPYRAGQNAASAQWSPNGREIIWSEQGTLFVVRPDGTHLRHISLQVQKGSYYASEPRWSADGKRIVFRMSVDGQADIFSANADGSDVVKVTSTCALAPGARVTICSPLPGTTVKSPVHVSATAIGRTSEMTVYIDSVFRFGTPSSVSVDLPVGVGSHSLRVCAIVNLARGGFERICKQISFAVTSGSTCSAPSSAGVHVCSPLAGSTVASPVHALARGSVSGAFARMELWVDGVKKGTSTSTLIDANLTLGAGTHRFNFRAVNSAGTILSRVVNAIVK